MILPPPIQCFQCRQWIKAVKWDRYEEHFCTKTPYADPSLRFQRQLCVDLQKYASELTDLIHPQQMPRWLDRRTGERVDVWEFFDRHAVLTAVCLEFGV